MATQVTTVFRTRERDNSAAPEAVAFPVPGGRYWLEMGHPKTDVRLRNMFAPAATIGGTPVEVGTNYTKLSEATRINVPGWTNVEQTLFLVARINPTDLANNSTGINRVVWGYLGGGINLHFDPTNTPNTAGLDQLILNANGNSSGANTLTLTGQGASGFGTGFADWTLVTYRQYADKTVRLQMQSIAYSASTSKVITAGLKTGPGTYPVGGGNGSALPVDIALVSAFDGALSDADHDFIVDQIEKRMTKLGISLGV